MSSLVLYDVYTDKTHDILFLYCEKSIDKRQISQSF